jgi:ubiquitin-conjugating enzyme E2 N
MMATRAFVMDKIADTASRSCGPHTSLIYHLVSTPGYSPCTIQETERLMSDSPPGITAAPHEDNLRYFDVSIAGPQGSPYEGEWRESRGREGEVGWRCAVIFCLEERWR